MISWLSFNLGLIAAGGLLITAGAVILMDYFVWGPKARRMIDEVWNNAFSLDFNFAKPEHSLSPTKHVSTALIRQVYASSFGTRSTVKRKRAMLERIRAHQTSLTFEQLVRRGKGGAVEGGGLFVDSVTFPRLQSKGIHISGIGDVTVAEAASSEPIFPSNYRYGKAFIEEPSEEETNFEQRSDEFSSGTARK